MNAPNVPVLMYHHVTPAGGMINACLLYTSPSPRDS